LRTRSSIQFCPTTISSGTAGVVRPIKTLEEMRGEAHAADTVVADVVARVAALDEYRALFADAFGGGRPVTAENLAKAIASFERTLVAANSPFDRFMRGDTTAMTPAAIQGMTRFEAAGCTG
jgi:cytochrome c peroxidase